MGAIEVVKTAYDLAKSIGNLELQRQLIDVQEKVLELQQENADLKEKVKQFQDNKAIGDSLVFEKNCYWRPKGDKHEGPFCSPCWDTGKGLIRLHIDSDGSWARCHSCDTASELQKRHYQSPSSDFDPY